MKPDISMSPRATYLRADKVAPGCMPCNVVVCRAGSAYFEILFRFTLLGPVFYVFFPPRPRGAEGAQEAPPSLRLLHLEKGEWSHGGRRGPQGELAQSWARGRAEGMSSEFYVCCTKATAVAQSSPLSSSSISPFLGRSSLRVWSPVDLPTFL